jgi:menaquinone-dependent protoporphyrinogen oxidase
MKLLIVYGTVEGQTRKICDKLKNEAKLNGHTVSINNSTGPNLSPFGFDAVIIASSIHNDKFQAPVERYVGDYSKVLNNMVGAFMTVSLTAVNDEPEGWAELEEITKGFLSRTSWHPTIIEHVAGAIRYSEFNFFKKYIARNVADKKNAQTNTSEDHEYTDWGQVKRILTKVEKEVAETTKSVG